MQVLTLRNINAGALKCAFDVRIPEFNNAILHGCMIFEKNGSVWASPPSNKVEKDGETKYWSIIRYEDKDEMEAFKKRLLDAYKDYVSQEQPEAIPDDLPF